MKVVLKAIVFAIVFAVILYAYITLGNVEGFAQCTGGWTWRGCGGYTPVLGERCSGSCYTGTCQNGTCSGSKMLGEKCGRYDCRNPGPNGRDTYCESGRCAEVPKMSFN